jgi:superfamily II DNA or RNA helicase
VRRNLYLTATAGRSSKDENAIFKHVFSHAVYYKPSALLTMNAPKKWVNYTMIEIDTHVKPNIYRYRVNGGRGMNPASYGKWVIKHDEKQTHFKVCVALIRSLFEKDQNSKILVFMPLIELCAEFKHFLNKALNYDSSFEYSLDLGTINSSNTKSENEQNKKCDVIITTIASCGTGTDLPGMTAIINCSPFVSKITAKQVFGRLRYCGKLCEFYDIYDNSVKMDVFWIKSRSKLLKSLALNVSKLKWENDN